jgi:hypothetical protein
MKTVPSLRWILPLFMGLVAFVFALDAAAQEQRGRGRQEATEQTDRQKREDAGRPEESVAQQDRSGRDAPAGRQRGERYVPRGLQEQDLREWQGGSPPGWSRGAKEGWGGAAVPPGQQRRGAGMQGRERPVLPPGAEDWDQPRREDWQQRIERSRERVREKVRGLAGDDAAVHESAVISLEGAASAGVPVEQAEAAIGRGLEAGMTGPEIEQMTRAMAYGAGQGMDGAALGSLVQDRIEAGERGEDLAVAIYQEVDRQRPAGPDAEAEPEPEPEKKKPWWRKIFGRG